MTPTASGRCLPFLVASADHQGTLRFKICEVDSMVASETQKERVERLLAADLAIAGMPIISSNHIFHLPLTINDFLKTTARS